MVYLLNKMYRIPLQLLLVVIVLQLLSITTRGLAQTDSPKITLYYSDLHLTYRGQSYDNYHQITVATTNIRLTCEGSNAKWVTPSSPSGYIADNNWGTLTIKLLTIGEAGLYKCSSTDGTSSVYIQAKGVGVYVERSNTQLPERIFPRRNFFIADQNDGTSYKFFCLMSNTNSNNAPSWIYPKHTRGTPHEDKYAIDSDYDTGSASLSVREDRWEILLSGRYTCSGEDINGEVRNISINIWNHGSPIRKTTVAASSSKRGQEATTVKAVKKQTTRDPSTLSQAHTDPLEQSNSLSDKQVTAAPGINLENRDNDLLKIGLGLGFLIAIVGWIFSITFICALWCYIQRRQRYQKISSKSSSLRESGENTNSNDSFILTTGLQPYKLRKFEKEPSSVGSPRNSEVITPLNIVQSQETLI